LLTELGARLKEARESKGYSLENLQEITKIQKRYLIGIEEGNYEMMPGKFYVRAFIKQYAEAVGLEPEELFDEYKNEIPVTHNEDLPEKLSRVQTRKTAPQSSSKILDFLPMLLVALFVIGALVVAWIFLQDKLSNNDDMTSQSENNQHQVEEDVNQIVEDTTEGISENSDDNSGKEKEEELEKEEEPEEIVEETPKQTINAVNTLGIKTTYELKNAESFNIEIEASGDTWIEIYNSKDVALFKGLLTAGQKQVTDLQQDPQAYIVVGDSTKTTIKVNGETVQYQIPPADEILQDIIINYSPAQ
jgi:cytoskeletal protein RodZ